MYLGNSKVSVNGVKSNFNPKDLRHVIAVKEHLLIKALKTLTDLEASLEDGKVVSDCSTDFNNVDNLETYWLDALFTDDDTSVNSAKYDQLCLQVDAEGNWH